MALGTVILAIALVIFQCFYLYRGAPRTEYTRQRNGLLIMVLVAFLLSYPHDSFAVVVLKVFIGLVAIGQIIFVDYIINIIEVRRKK